MLTATANNTVEDLDKTCEYFRSISQNLPDIQIDKKKLGGMPVIKNTRIPVSLIIACIKDGMTFEDICNDYGLTYKNIQNAMEYVIEILDTPYQE